MGAYRARTHLSFFFLNFLFLLEVSPLVSSPASFFNSPLFFLRRYDLSGVTSEEKNPPFGGFAGVVVVFSPHFFFT